MIAFCGDNDVSAIRATLYSDADFGGCPFTKRSTSGMYLAMIGPKTHCPIAAQSKRQTCVSHSTPEAEIVAADNALRTAGLPCLQLLETIFPVAADISGQGGSRK